MKQNPSTTDGYGDDDDEDSLTPVKRQRTMKKEEDQENRQTATLFKMDDRGNIEDPIDLINEE